MNQTVPDPHPASPAAAVPSAVLCDASDWGVLAFDGADAGAFLQGQLSSDVARLVAGTGQWTSYSSPKGRMLASGYLWRTPAGDGYRLALSADIAGPTRRRIAMFVLRSRVAVADLAPTHVRIGVGGPEACQAAGRALGVELRAGFVARVDDADVVALPDGRVLVVSPVESAGRLRERLAAVTTPGDGQAWRRFAVDAGVALVRAETVEAMLPQSANLDVLGGVALNRAKGCFPGQEIIKRTQALGHLKERLYAFRAAVAAIPVGTRIYGATFGDQASGTVVESAADGAGSRLLAVVQIRAAQNDALHLGAPDGPTLDPQPLPYALAPEGGRPSANGQP